MNYIRHLSGFFNKVSADERLNPTHVSLYVSLFQFWNACRFHNPISISRQEAMNVSKISSKVTYHKCIRELHLFGYLRYEPSYNPFKGSLVYLFDFQTGTELANKINRTKIETGSELVPNSNHTKIGSGAVQVLIPYINNSNNSKQKTIVNAITKKNKNEKFSNSKSSTDKIDFEKEKKEMLRAKKKSETGFQADQQNSQTEIAIFKNEEVSPSKKSTERKRSFEGFKRPLLSETKIYFAQNQWPENEASKFYNHYESNGWMIGKTPMANWFAAANNWILNSQNFNNDKTKTRPGNLHTSTGKNYNEPL
jgi:hypothetical protein